MFFLKVGLAGNLVRWTDKRADGRADPTDGQVTGDNVSGRCHGDGARWRPQGGAAVTSAVAVTSLFERLNRGVKGACRSEELNPHAHKLLQRRTIVC